MGLSLLRRKRPPSGLPDGTRIYAIGDVHGRADLLERVSTRIDKPIIAAHPNDRLIQVLVGDYIVIADQIPAMSSTALVERARSKETVLLGKILS